MYVLLSNGVRLIDQAAYDYTLRSRKGKVCGPTVKVIYPASELCLYTYIDDNYSSVQPLFPLSHCVLVWDE